MIVVSSISSIHVTSDWYLSNNNNNNASEACKKNKKRDELTAGPNFRSIEGIEAIVADFFYVLSQ